MPLKDHSKLSGIDNHAPFAFVYSNKTIREAATTFLPEDKYKVALQEDDNSFWVLISTSPIIWKRI